MTGPERPAAPDPSAAPEPDRPPAPEPRDPRTGPTEPFTAGGRDIRRLTRSSSDRLLGGVSGGLGAYFGIDPILLRIAFVVLTLVGGVGALAYLGAWGFIPSDQTPAGASAGTGRRAAVVVGAVVLVLAALPFLGPVAVLGGALLPVALVGLLVLVLARAAGREDEDDPVRLLARITLALVLVAAAVVAVLAVGAAAAFGGDVVIASLLVVAGVTLLVGAFVGGARWLIVPALIVALPLGVVAAADLDFEGGIGERSYRPTAGSQLQPAYTLGMGELVVDLRDLEMPAGRTDLKLDLGLGEAIVFVPEGVCVASDVRVGAGYAQILDRENGGLDVDWRDSPDSAGAPRLVIDADVGMGALQVVRDERSVRGDRRGDQWWDEYELAPERSAGNTACAVA